jgi:hypothetical protein
MGEALNRESSWRKPMDSPLTQPVSAGRTSSELDGTRWTGPDGWDPVSGPSAPLFDRSFCGLAALGQLNHGHRRGIA